MNAPGPALALKEYEATAPALKIELQSLEVHGPNPDLEGALQAAVKGRANALITIGSSLLSRYPKQIADLAIKSRLPAMCDRIDYVEAGGLVPIQRTMLRVSGVLHLRRQDPERRQARRSSRRAAKEV
jgi:ABC-type uncharacterized transport system substrate-binding protein